MGATRNTGYLENLIAYDASNNVAIATTAIDNAFKITMGGSVKMTGALSGTSATFSGDVTINSANSLLTANNTIISGTARKIQVWNAVSAYIDVLSFATNAAATFNGDITINSTNGILTAQNLQISGTARKIQVWNAVSAYIDAVTFASTGAATFSSSVNIGTTASTVYGTLNVIQQSVSAPSFVRGIELVHPNGTGGTGGYIGISMTGQKQATIQVGDDLTAGNLLLQSQGGNVGIGINSPSELLHVYKSSTFATLLVENGTSNSYALYQARTANSGTWQWGCWNNNTYRVGLSGVADYMTITSGGNVGIGTTSPLDSTKFGLQITSPAGKASYARINYTGFTGLDLIQGGDGTGYIILNDNNDLRIYTNLTERMRITSVGNVGIGTTSPNVALEVSGSSNITSRIRAVKTSSGTIEIGADRDTFGSPYISAVTNSNLDFFTNDSHRMRITSGGNVLMGKTSTGQVLVNGFEFNPSSNYISICSSVAGDTATYVANTASAGTRYLIRFYGTSAEVGKITHDGTNTTYATTSDYRLKEDLQEVKGLEKVLSIKTYDFKWKNSENRMDGVIAHELQEILGYAVVGEKDGVDMQGVDYSKLTPILVKAIQEQQAQIEELKSKLS